MNDSDEQMDVYSGVRWSAVAKYGVQALDVVISIVVARIVAPEAYGLLGMAVVITGFLQTFHTLGFGSAVIQRKQISEALLSSLFFVSSGMGCILALLLVCMAPVFSWVYSDARVGPIIAALSISFLLSSPALIPSALLTRRMAFQRLAWVDIAVCIVRGVSVIALAVAGWGVWALVWSSIAGTAVRTVLLYGVSAWRPRWVFRWSEVRSVFSFGANLTGFSIFNYFARNADKLVIGIFLGPVALGYYALAYKLMLLPRDSVSQVVTRVLFPAFSRMQDDDERLANAYLRACGAIAFITFPMMAGLAVVAGPFVEVVLGDKWLSAVPLISVLAPLGMIQSVGAIVNQLYLAKGRSDWMLWVGVVKGVFIVCSFLVGLPWGVLGVAVSYSVTNLALSFPSWSLAFRFVNGLRLSDVLRVLAPYSVVAVVMALVVASCRLILQSTGLPPSLCLGIWISLGVATYVVVGLCARLAAWNEFAQLLPARWSIAVRRVVAGVPR